MPQPLRPPAPLPPGVTPASMRPVDPGLPVPRDREWRALGRPGMIEQLIAALSPGQRLLLEYVTRRGARRESLSIGPRGSWPGFASRTGRRMAYNPTSYGLTRPLWLTSPRGAHWAVIAPANVAAAKVLTGAPGPRSVGSAGMQTGGAAGASAAGERVARDIRRWAGHLVPRPDRYAVGAEGRDRFYRRGLGPGEGAAGAPVRMDAGAAQHAQEEPMHFADLLRSALRRASFSIATAEPRAGSVNGFWPGAKRRAPRLPSRRQGFSILSGGIEPGSPLDVPFEPDPAGGQRMQRVATTPRPDVLSSDLLRRIAQQVPRTPAQRPVPSYAPGGVLGPLIEWNGEPLRDWGTQGSIKRAELADSLDRKEPFETTDSYEVAGGEMAARDDDFALRRLVAHGSLQPRREASWELDELSPPHGDPHDPDTLKSVLARNELLRPSASRRPLTARREAADHLLDVLPEHLSRSDILRGANLLRLSHPLGRAGVQRFAGGAQPAGAPQGDPHQSLMLTEILELARAGDPAARQFIRRMQGSYRPPQAGGQTGEAEEMMVPARYASGVRIVQGPAAARRQGFSILSGGIQPGSPFDRPFETDEHGQRVQPVRRFRVRRGAPMSDALAERIWRNPQAGSIRLPRRGYYSATPEGATRQRKAPLGGRLGRMPTPNEYEKEGYRPGGDIANQTHRVSLDSLPQMFPSSGLTDLLLGTQSPLQAGLGYEGRLAAREALQPRSLRSLLEAVRALRQQPEIQLWTQGWPSGQKEHRAYLTRALRAARYADPLVRAGMQSAPRRPGVDPDPNMSVRVTRRQGFASAPPSRIPPNAPYASRPPGSFAPPAYRSGFESSRLGLVPGAGPRHGGATTAALPGLTPTGGAAVAYVKLPPALIVKGSGAAPRRQGFASGIAPTTPPRKLGPAAPSLPSAFRPPSPSLSLAAPAGRSPRPAAYTPAGGYGLQTSEQRQRATLASALPAAPRPALPRPSAIPASRRAMPGPVPRAAPNLRLLAPASARIAGRVGPAAIPAARRQSGPSLWDRLSGTVTVPMQWGRPTGGPEWARRAARQGFGAGTGGAAGEPEPLVAIQRRSPGSILPRGSSRILRAVRSGIGQGAGFEPRDAGFWRGALRAGTATPEGLEEKLWAALERWNGEALAQGAAQGASRRQGFSILPPTTRQEYIQQWNAFRNTPGAPPPVDMRPLERKSREGGVPKHRAPVNSDPSSYEVMSAVVGPAALDARMLQLTGARGAEGWRHAQDRGLDVNVEAERSGRGQAEVLAEGLNQSWQMAGWGTAGQRRPRHHPIDPERGERLAAALARPRNPQDSLLKLELRHPSGYDTNAAPDWGKNMLGERYTPHNPNARPEYGLGRNPPVWNMRGQGGADENEMYAHLTPLRRRHDTGSQPIRDFGGRRALLTAIANHLRVRDPRLHAGFGPRILLRDLYSSMSDKGLGRGYRVGDNPTRGVAEPWEPGGMLGTTPASATDVSYVQRINPVIDEIIASGEGARMPPEWRLFGPPPGQSFAAGVPYTEAPAELQGMPGSSMQQFARDPDSRYADRSRRAEEQYQAELAHAALLARLGRFDPPPAVQRSEEARARALLRSGAPLPDDPTPALWRLLERASAEQRTSAQPDDYDAWEASRQHQPAPVGYPAAPATRPERSMLPTLAARQPAAQSAPALEVPALTGLGSLAALPYLLARRPAGLPAALARQPARQPALVGAATRRPSYPAPAPRDESDDLLGIRAMLTGNTSVERPRPQPARPALPEPRQPVYGRPGHQPRTGVNPARLAAAADVARLGRGVPASILLRGFQPTTPRPAAQPRGAADALIDAGSRGDLAGLMRAAAPVPRASESRRAFPAAPASLARSMFPVRDLGHGRGLNRELQLAGRLGSMVRQGQPLPQGAQPRRLSSEARSMLAAQGFMPTNAGSRRLWLHRDKLPRPAAPEAPRAERFPMARPPSDWNREAWGLDRASWERFAEDGPVGSEGAPAREVQQDLAGRFLAALRAGQHGLRGSPRLVV